MFWSELTVYPHGNETLQGNEIEFWFDLIYHSVVYQGPNQTNQDSIKAWLKHEELNSTRQQQEVINQTLAPARLNTPCNIKTKGSG